MASATKPRVVLVPGNGMDGDLDDLRSCNYYGWAEREFVRRGFEVRLSPMPDPLYAKESLWVPFIKDTLGADEGAVLIGHSSGAAAALRVAEKQRLRGLVLVAAYDSDLGDELERASGYFSRPFDWAAVGRNCGFVVQFAGARDGLVPIDVQRRVGAALGDACDYRELPRRDHFFAPPFAELLDAVEGHLARSSG